ncbi:hypothetical protein J0895_05390 [Phormidium pseudopriestleyi FRX01]|uniref:Hybrid sensor histidine kinase/response regulator n=1 Tax=Phormidium pseudopriestleyi FRX01 TaxID=1759528 RepID=A0ABS3FP07_9CYAN|nr:hypothetical protein [Phormidium pseudopriestleyi]MBO0348548.1 hypothetical protein [Phormidium pseudopriestleyi FRX01]
MVSSNRDQLQALIADIDGILRKMNSRLAWWSSGETRRVLERVRLYLDSQLASEGSHAVAVSAMQPYAIAPKAVSEAQEAQAVLQALMQDLSGLRTNLMQPLQEEIATLRQERYSLMEEVRQLEQRQRHYQTLAGQQAHQQQAIADFLQALLDPLQDRLSQQVSQAIGQIETQLLTEGTADRLEQSALESKFREDLNAFTTAQNSGLLSPEARLEELQRLQEESDRLLMSLDSTLRVVFEALERNVNSYNDSLVQGLDKMHRLGQQGELMFSALVNHLAQLLGQETSSYLKSSLRLLSSTQAAIVNEQDSPLESDPEPSNLESPGDRLKSPPTPPPSPETPKTRGKAQGATPPQKQPTTPLVSTPPSASELSPEDSPELLTFPFAGAELTPPMESAEEGMTEAFSDLDKATETAPQIVPKTREQMSQDNFELAAQWAESSETEEFSEAIAPENSPNATSDLDFEDLPELDLEGWVTADDDLPENWELSEGLELEENLPPPSEFIPESGDGDLFALSEEPNSGQTQERSPDGEDDLFAELESRTDAPGMGGEYSEEYMDDFLFGDRLESLVPKSDASIPEEITPVRSPLEINSPPAPQKTEPPREPEPPTNQTEESTDDLFADFETVTEATGVSPEPATLPDPEPEIVEDTAASLMEDWLPEFEEEAIVSDLDLAEDWEETGYIPASLQEDLLPNEELEDDLDNLWLSNTGIKRLDEDLSKLEEAEAKGASPDPSDWPGTEFSAEQWLEDLADEPPLSESVSLEELDGTLPWEESGDASLDADGENLLWEAGDSDWNAIGLEADFTPEMEPPSPTENGPKPAGKSPVQGAQPSQTQSNSRNSQKTVSGPTAGSSTPKGESKPEATGRSNNVLPTLDDIFAELMATNPPPVVKVTVEEDVHHETVEDFFADFMDDEDEAKAPADPEPEAEEPEVPISPDDDLANPTLDTFFESWSDAPNVSK